jgi:4-hydroxy-3-methylbut-2-enyl diphosphate reductase
MAFENNIEAAASQAPRTAEIGATGRCHNDIERPKDAWRDSEILGYHCGFGGEPMTNASPKSQSEKILLRVRPRGFCAGVVRAVDIVELALEAYGPPVYVHHEIVHNRYVVEQLRKGGAIFVEAVEDVPEGAVLVFSAHGVPPAVRAEAQARRLRVIDATCPLVTKVHLEALKFARDGRTIILIGHKDHQEIVGTSGEAPEQTVVVDSVEAVDRLEVQDSSHLAFLTQTTLSLYDTRDIVARLRQRFPSIVGPASDDICYATQNRQEAVEHMAKEMELILVVGSPNSSNSNRLVEVAERAGVPARLIDDAGGIRPEWLEGVNRVGLTAGASAPEVLVEEVSRRLESFGFTDQRDIDLIREDVRFTLPPELTIIAPLSKQT